ncbi:MAG: glycoside hydrolase family 27 protein [Clostridia bacterium]|nr:glycoside hydrolase family 27 protein [Clostridia bacterium]
MIAQYPPMGWNSWDCYGAAVNEAQVRQNADYIAKHLKAYGWEYVVVDIQWYQPTASSHAYEPFSSVAMDGYGRLLPAENRFPSSADGKGFRPLADHIHSLGLKFGIHIMRGMPRMAAHKHLPVLNSAAGCDELADPNSICAWNPDMYGIRQDHPEARRYYDSIFALYAEWGVDFVKCDDIAREYPRCEREIELISEACANCGRDMVLSLSPGPAPIERAEHLKRWANMWRITDDFWDDWSLLKNMFERAEKWCIHSGPGHWPDADMLPVGALRQCYAGNGVKAGEKGGPWTCFTEPEQRTMMTLWCMMRAPLMAGAELTKNDDFTLALLTNAEVIAIGKESYCGHPLYTTESECVWFAPRKDGTGAYIALFNFAEEEREIRVDDDAAEYPFNTARELWTGETVRELKAKLQPHDAAVWRLDRADHRNQPPRDPESEASQ